MSNPILASSPHTPELPEKTEFTFIKPDLNKHSTPTKTATVLSRLTHRPELTAADIADLDHPVLAEMRRPGAGYAIAGYIPYPTPGSAHDRLEFFQQELKDKVSHGSYILAEEAGDLLTLARIAGRHYYREMGIPVLWEGARTIILMQQVNATAGWHYLMPVLTNARINLYDGQLNYAIDQMILWRPSDLNIAGTDTVKILSVAESQALRWVLVPDLDN